MHIGLKCKPHIDFLGYQVATYKTLLCPGELIVVVAAGCIIN